MENPQHYECDTPDCCYWSEDGCTKGTAITIQEHHCVDYEEQPKPGSLTVTIEVQGGLVANVYASPDLPEIRIELLDMDNAAAASPANLRWAERMLAATAAAHNVGVSGAAQIRSDAQGTLVE